MADQSNSKSPFSFATAGKGLFGSQAPSTTTAGGFGSAAPAPASFGGGTFGAPTAPKASGTSSGSTGGIFGNAGGGNPFNSKPDQPAASGSPAFGGFSTANAFSAAPAAQPASGAPSASIFSTPSKPADAGATSQSVLGAASTGGGPFGAKPLSDANTTTPTSKPSISMFGNSTTPAGPPPAANIGAGSSSIFSFSKAEAQPSFSLGGANASSTKPSTPSFFSSLGGPSANTNKPQGSQAPLQSSNVFGLPSNNPNNTSSKAQTSQAQAAAPLTSNDKPTPNLFSNLGSQNTSSSTSAPPQFSSVLSQPQSPAAPSTGLFGGLGGSTANATGGTSTTISNGPKSTFPTSTASSNDVPKDKTTTSSSTSGAPAASSSNLFGGFGKGPTPSTESQSQAPPATTTTDASNSSTTNLGASTSGPPPAARSRLKDKTMDDIITRWASDLSKYQKDFQTQAEKVASWDRLLVENSEKIQRLYGSTLEAERATTEVERQLTSVESDQAELESWLNHYETEVDNMIQNQVGKSDGLSGPDQERERTYQLATRLSDRLDDMGKDLGSMIEEINDASSNLSKHTKSDDPLTQVVRVLNSHLTQLQQIDQGAARLQLKVKEAQRAGQSIRPSNGLNGPSSDAAEAFHRSFIGR